MQLPCCGLPFALQPKSLYFILMKTAIRGASGVCHNKQQRFRPNSFA